RRGRPTIGATTPVAAASRQTQKRQSELSLPLVDRVHLVFDLDTFPNLLGQRQRTAFIIDESVSSRDAAFIDPLVSRALVDGRRVTVVVGRARLGVTRGARRWSLSRGHRLLVLGIADGNDRDGGPQATDEVHRYRVLTELANRIVEHNLAAIDLL